MPPRDHCRPDSSLILTLAAPLILGTILSAFFLHAITPVEPINFEEFALPKGTATYYASIQGHRIHCSGISDFALCLEGVRARNAHQVALWIGNSQIHAINQLKPGEENAPPLLFRLFAPQGLDFITISFPNATLQETYVMFEYVRPYLPLKILVLPLVFSDLRQPGLRDEFAAALSNPQLRESLEATEIGRRIINEYGMKSASKADFAGLNNTIQERTEIFFDNWLDCHWQLWHERPQARGRLFTSALKLFHFAFGITAQSKRRIIEAKYRTNIAALEALIDSALAHHIDVLLYIAPIRSDIEMPYVPGEYECFKKEIERLAEEKGVGFANLESLVPGPLWGLKESSTMLATDDLEVDFKHFTSAAHRVLADELARLVHIRLNRMAQ